jgi:hypothetical protein
MPQIVAAATISTIWMVPGALALVD